MPSQYISNGFYVSNFGFRSCWWAEHSNVNNYHLYVSYQQHHRTLNNHMLHKTWWTGIHVDFTKCALCAVHFQYFCVHLFDEWAWKWSWSSSWSTTITIISSFSTVYKRNLRITSIDGPKWENWTKVQNYCCQCQWIHKM